LLLTMTLSWHGGSMFSHRLNSNRFYQLLCLLVFGAFATAPQALANNCAPADESSVVFVGHSLVNYDMPQMFRQLAEDASKPVQTADHVINGAPLKWNWDRRSASLFDGDWPPAAFAGDALATGEYDHLVITEGIPLDLQIQWNESSRYAGYFMDLARTHNGLTRVFLYETWHSRNEANWLDRIVSDRALWMQIVNEVNEVRSGEPMYLVPAGTALRELVLLMESGQVPGLTNRSQLFADDIHMNDLGNYFIACVMYAAIYRESPEGLRFQTTNVWGGNFTSPNADAAAIMQQVAWQVVSTDVDSGYCPDGDGGTGGGDGGTDGGDGGTGGGDGGTDGGDGGTDGGDGGTDGGDGGTDGGDGGTDGGDGGTDGGDGGTDGGGEEPVCSSVDADNKLKVMFVGVASREDSEPEWLADLATDAGYVGDYRVMNNGAPLQFNWDRRRRDLYEFPWPPSHFPEDELAVGNVSALVLAEGIPLMDQIRWSDPAYYVAQFANLAKQHNADTQVFLAERWPRRENRRWANQIRQDRSLWQGIVDDANDALNFDCPVRLIPLASALRELDTAVSNGDIPGYNSMDQFFENSRDLNHEGNYFLALVYYAYLTGASPEGLGRVGSNPWGGALTAPNSDACVALQALAWSFYQNNP
jgi:hypothetical protein